MRKKLQRGFSAPETILVLVAVGLIAFVVWFVFHSSSDTSETLGNAANTQTEVPKQNNTAARTAEKAKVYTIRTDANTGKYLADISGKVLYTYGADTKGVSNCSGDCLAAWPVYKATVTDNLPADISVITRTDGNKQYAYKGMPLYYYVNDTTGQVTGEGVNNFHVAKP